MLSIYSQTIPRKQFCTRKSCFTGMTICLSMSHHPISAHKIHANLGSLSMLFWHIRLYICLLMMFYLGCTEEPGWSKGVLHYLELHVVVLLLSVRAVEGKKCAMVVAPTINDTSGCYVSHSCLSKLPISTNCNASKVGRTHQIQTII